MLEEKQIKTAEKQQFAMQGTLKMLENKALTLGYLLKYAFNIESFL